MTRPKLSNSAIAAAVRKKHLGRTLRGLLPDRLFFGPVFDVQMRVAGRKWQTYAVRFLYGAMLTFVASAGLLSAWETTQHHAIDDTGGNAARLQALQSIAPQIAISIGVFQFIALILAGPISIGPSLGDERRTGSLAALMTSPISAIQVVCSRLGSQMVQLTILTLIATPLLLALRVFGGVSAWAILAVTALCLTTGMVGAALSILFSLGSRRAAAAALSAVVCQISLWIAPAAIVGILNHYGLIASSGRGAPPSLITVIAISPPAALGMLIFSLSGTSGMPPALLSAWPMAIVQNLVIITIATMLAARKLRRVMNVAPLPVTAKLSRRQRRALTTPVPASSAQGVAPGEAVRERKASREVSDRPVLWREVRIDSFGRKWHGPGMLVVLMGLLVYLYYEVGIEDRELHPVILWILGFLLIAAASAVAGPAIAGERESRTWEVLCTTPLSARDIVTGKLLGALRRLWLIPTVLAVHFFFATVSGVIAPTATLCALVAVVPAIIFLVCTGLWFSSFLPRPSSAAVLNLGVGAFLWLVLPMLVLMVGSLLESSTGLRWFASLKYLFAFHPLVMAGTAIDTGLEQPGGGGRYDLGPSSLSFATFFLILLGVAGCYFAVAWLAFKGAVRNVRRSTSRAA